MNRSPNQIRRVTFRDVRRAISSLATIVILAVMTAVANGGPDDMVETILQSVAENESLYEDIEVRWAEVYSKPNYSNAHRAIAAQSDRFEYRSVRQNGMFFLNKDGEIVGPPDAPPEQPDTWREARRKGFDGDVTRWLEFRGGNLGNIVFGPAYDWHIMHAHTIPLRWRRTAVPLATYLRGRDAILAHPGGQESDVPQGMTLTSSYDGEETVDGLACHRIKLKGFHPDGNGGTKETGHRILWLATERNFLPVKAEGYNDFYSRDLAIETSSLSDLREIAEGVWFPFHGEITVYDEIVLLEKKELILSWQREYLVSEVSLSPSYDVEFFRDVVFPDGTPVYEVNDGKIVKSYVQGAKPIAADDSADPTTSGAKRSSRLLFVLLNAALILVLTLGVVWRVRAARARPQKVD